MLIDSFLFRLGAVLSALVEEAVEAVLIRESDLFVSIRLTHDLRDLEHCGVIPSADEILAIHERIRHHFRIATLRGEDGADALNRAWADGRMVLDMLVWLSRHLQERELFPGLAAFVETPA
ncbi:hypothetical protein Rumeso_04061 [Rubellimicrobium mesophilum DSM 19309]|uniref:Uncharacterized protein n=1 Tax=Rubellimicrobium mesophilum DSM 19309 TaxID=442562 RepID=A0A017HJ42_9RHOB|nr:hypothetical protein [Rubellimicrobium mesophilum]EYD74376.1 hypothetical protein Rumeso_04061 [Rubellimicrobium mesophilum DSM 19309]